MNGILEQPPEYEWIDDGVRPRWRRVGAWRVDLHCHSTFSVERIRFLPGVSYRPLLEPEKVYDLARRRGMDFVTLTDHDTIDGCKALLDRRGELPDFIVAEEVTVRFPDGGPVVHVNVYDLDESHHRELQRLRDNVFDLVDYCRRSGRLFVLNHMTWNAQHRRLTREQIECMLELFPVFEGLNGARSYQHNAFAWFATRGHGKVLVAGSDSHTHRVGTTYTLVGPDPQTRADGGAASAGAPGRPPGARGLAPRTPEPIATRAELIDGIRLGRVGVCGSFGTPEQLADDVWLLLQKSAERRVAEASGRFERLVLRAAQRFGRAVYPMICLGYHMRQRVLVRDFARALAV